MQCNNADNNNAAIKLQNAKIAIMIKDWIIKLKK